MAASQLSVCPRELAAPGSLHTQAQPPKRLEPPPESCHPSRCILARTLRETPAPVGVPLTLDDFVKNHRRDTESAKKKSYKNKPLYPLRLCGDSTFQAVCDFYETTKSEIP